MIKLTKLNGSVEVINADLIESAEATPDTIIRLTTGRKMVVRENIDLFIAKVVDYKRSIAAKISIIERSSEKDE
ncbi:MAG: flagellar FlbD family protein [Fibrobacteres bacterium]|nr:flagellar FlbD family protein [Fibrobacterota bacterium]